MLFYFAQVHEICFRPNYLTHLGNKAMAIFCERTPVTGCQLPQVLSTGGLNTY